MPIFKILKDRKIPDRCKIEREEDDSIVIRCPRGVTPEEAIQIHDLKGGEPVKHPDYGLVCYDKGDHLICHVNDPSECPEGTYYIRKAPIWQEIGRYQCFVKK